MIFASACALVGGGTSSSIQRQIRTQLRVSTGNGHVKARLALVNLSSRELLLNELSEKGFKDESNAGKLKGLKSTFLNKAQPLVIKPGQTVDLAFNLEKAFLFKDRLTRYRIRFDNSEIKSNEVQLWY